MLPIPGTPPLWTTSRSNSPGLGSTRQTSSLGAGASGDSILPKFAHSSGRPQAVTWASARAGSARVGGYTLHENTQRGWLSAIMSFMSGLTRATYDELPQKDKPARGRKSHERPGRSWTVVAVLARAAFRLRKILALLVSLVALVTLFYTTPLRKHYLRKYHLGGGEKFVVILAANQGGGVMEWKGPREWAIERDSVKNKKRYVGEWGYDLEIVDMAIKKRYAHEWRESWEKVDTLKKCMHQYPKAEWFWWLDLNTFIMEPTYSLQKHIFDDLERNTYRDINIYNPLNITHPLPYHYLDDISASATGDGKASSIDLLIPQDCSGFNLGSFFVRRSAWTDRLLDIWWDPVHYEQRHMQWEHKEQDALEYLYTQHAWVRTHTAFLPQRSICSYPPGACGANDTRIHYNATERDFVVNMAGCEWGRDCWGEMYSYRELSDRLNRPRWERFKERFRAWRAGVVTADDGPQAEAQAQAQQKRDSKVG